MSDPRKLEAAIRRVRDQQSFIQELLVASLGWPLDEAAAQVEDIAFDWSAADLRAKGLDRHMAEGTIRQLQPVAGNPWGVFLVEFRHPEVFTTGRGMTGPLRGILRGLVPSKRKQSDLASFKREHLLFICTHGYQHYRFAYFKSPPKGAGAGVAPLAAFGWGPGDPIRTLCEFNLPALVWPEPPCAAAAWVAAWAEAFDVEKVTKRFYEDYAAVFAQVEGAIGKTKELKGDELRLYTQTLFNRLMFLRFIERKGWLEFQGRHDYLRALFAAEPIRGKSFYKGRLQPLFFEGLAVEGKQESEAIGHVPFLNGGLFEQSDLDRKVKDLPDQVFAAIIAADGLFYRYNFTVEESTPSDIEVAVDPEMLGKVFEELVTGRHESGSYYTPRPVVSFMCREALKGVLTDKTGAKAEAIRSLVDGHEVRGLRETHAREVLKALDDLKAVDPACGSGAYLLGLLHEMVSLYRLLYSEKLTRDARSIYELKLRIVSHNLYGVDIDPFATNIAMLRLWLSLAVEADEPVPLPNLDFKIETGDSLLAPDPQEMPDLFRGLLQAEANALVNMKEQFLTSHGREKEQYRDQIRRTERKLRTALSEHYGESVVDWRVQFPEAFSSGERGFDVVVANPPYVRQELITALKPSLEQIYPEVYTGVADLYVYFYARAMQLLRLGGLMAFITPNKFFRAGYGKKLREYLASCSRLHVVVDFADFPIFQAITYPAIIIAQRCPAMRKREQEDVLAYNWKPSDELTNIAPTVAAHGVPLPQRDLPPEGWRILDRSVSQVFERLRATGKALARSVGGPFYGIKTGCNEVFEIDEETHAALIDEDPRSDEIIRPWLRGRNVRRWDVEWGGSYLIFARRGIEIDRYPAIKRYLSGHRDRLEPRPPNVAAKNWAGRKPGTYKWYEVQDAIDYWEEFENPKIVYQVIATYQQFAFTAEPFLSNDKTWIIPQPPAGLIGILNSKLAWFFLDQITPKLQGGAFELRSPYMSQIPIVAPTSDLIAKVNAIEKRVAEVAGHSEEVMSLEADIDEIVVRMYGLSKDEVKVVDEALAVSDNRFPRKLRDTDEYKEYMREMFAE